MPRQECGCNLQFPNLDLLGILPKPHSAPARRPSIPDTGVLGAKDEGGGPQISRVMPKGIHNSKD